jgi:DNA-binding CsgD family transcriptional regulator
MSQSISETQTAQIAPSPSFEGVIGSSKDERNMALLALTHSWAEHKLYLAMLETQRAAGGGQKSLSATQLMYIAGISSATSARRALAGLVRKNSMGVVADGAQPARNAYRVYEPGEIFRRRLAAGAAPYPAEVVFFETSPVFNLIAEHVIKRPDLSRREALVTLYCAEGLSNIAIARQLGIDEKTVKYHLRHIYVKFGIKRRTELVANLIQDRNKLAVMSDSG